jgi:hypothetical protein
LLVRQVPILGHFVERIAVGMQHVAALTGPLDGQTGRAEVCLPSKQRPLLQALASLLLCQYCVSREETVNGGCASASQMLDLRTCEVYMKGWCPAGFCQAQRTRKCLCFLTLLRMLAGLLKQEGEECSVIYTWGRGREGQLGVGMHADSAVPAAVDELRGRHVLQVGYDMNFLHWQQTQGLVMHSMLYMA